MPRTALTSVLACGFMAVAALQSQTTYDPPAHAVLANATACAPCHEGEARSRWESRKNRPCTASCLACHTKEEMTKHHPVGNRITKPPHLPLPLTQDQKSACFTCHDLGNRRFDAVRWKAESLFGRLFHREARHKTYFLVTRNDRGQLCLACH